MLTKAVEKLKQLRNPHYINIDINQNFTIPEEPLDEMPKEDVMEVEDEFVKDLAMSMETEEEEEIEGMEVENSDDVGLDHLEKMPLTIEENLE